MWKCIRPESSLLDAARKMKRFDIGPLPVCGEEDRLVGMLTDRDIIVRAIADGRDLEETKVQDIMTPRVHYCMEHHDVEHVARLMRNWQVRRLVVINDDRRLVGIVSLGDLIVETGDEEMAGEALEGISLPAGSV